MSVTTDDRDLEQLLAAGEVGHYILMHALGVTGPELALRSAEARIALAWASIQDPDIIRGLRDLFRLAKTVEARSCTCLGSGT